MRAAPDALISGTFVAIATAILAGRPEQGAITLGVAVLVTALAAMAIKHSLGGATGDAYGAVNKLVEVACYGALIATWHRPAGRHSDGLAR